MQKWQLFLQYPKMFTEHKTAAVALPHSWSRDDADEEDPTPAERVARWENENVLEEERVQLCQLPTKTEKLKSKVTFLG